MCRQSIRRLFMAAVVTVTASPTAAQVMQPGQPVRQVALEPSELQSSLSEMDRRGITYGPLRPVVSRASDGSANTLWTNVTLRQFSDSDGPADATVHIFLSEYNPTYVNVAERRARLQSELIAKQGGPLGVEALMELVIGVHDLDGARALWQKLLAPTRASESSVWHIGDGPAIRLVAAEQNAGSGTGHPCRVTGAGKNLPTREGTSRD